ncbi:hypothetical protein [Pantoea sp. Mhis]|uniref:hypothetical protein n=1 Tax=Pantoea sp. Mhis TaxID=2576759 RepID=UPI0013573DDB|nr:hypothetical protein [Pantoea sp. Mhis]MXP56456.1 hypothetical protein [Pantoea sp. Mhis]
MQKSLPSNILNNMILVNIGNVLNTISNSMLEILSIIGLDLHLVAPKSYWPQDKLIEIYATASKNMECKNTLSLNIYKVVKNINFICTNI